jgi:hypothetical protein
MPARKGEVVEDPEDGLRRSMVGRLLSEISWEGNARRYRTGGLTFENVLTMQVLQALDLLPRTAFLGSILSSTTRGAKEAVELLARESEDAALTFLPHRLGLGPNLDTGYPEHSVQPDGVIVTPSVYCVVEAKRVLSGSFQEPQLAKELVVAWQGATKRAARPLLLLFLPYPPPVPVRHHKRLPIPEAIELALGAELAKAEGVLPSAGAMLAELDSTVSYATWLDIRAATSDVVAQFRCDDESVSTAVARTADTLIAAIDLAKGK